MWEGQTPSQGLSLSSCFMGLTSVSFQPLSQELFPPRGPVRAGGSQWEVELGWDSAREAGIMREGFLKDNPPRTW